MTVYFDSPGKLQKWRDALSSILEINQKLKSRRLSKARSQDGRSGGDVQNPEIIKDRQKSMDAGIAKYTFDAAAAGDGELIRKYPSNGV